MPDITSRPYRPKMACEACVFGRGEHAAWCNMGFFRSVVLKLFHIRSSVLEEALMGCSSIQEFRDKYEEIKTNSPELLWVSERGHSCL